MCGKGGMAMPALYDPGWRGVSKLRPTLGRAVLAAPPIASSSGAFPPSRWRDDRTEETQGLADPTPLRAGYAAWGRGWWSNPNAPRHRRSESLPYRAGLCPIWRGRRPRRSVQSTVCPIGMRVFNWNSPPPRAWKLPRRRGGTTVLGDDWCVGYPRGLPQTGSGLGGTD